MFNAGAATLFAVRHMAREYGMRGSICPCAVLASPGQTHRIFRAASFKTSAFCTETSAGFSVSTCCRASRTSRAMAE